MNPNEPEHNAVYWCVWGIAIALMVLAVIFIGSVMISLTVKILH